MRGRLPKIRRRKKAEQDDAEQQATEVAPAIESTPQAVTEQTQVQPVVPVAYPSVPADVAPDETHTTGFRDRGRFRRRLRYLRRVRELGFRDLGGLVFDLHRFGRQGDELVRGKLSALDAVDRELRALERVLLDRRTFIDLREPGIAACPRCAALHGSDARFCPSCGMRLSGPLAVAEVGDGPVAVATDPTVHGGEIGASRAVSAAEAGSTPVSATLAHDAAAPAPVADEPTQAHPTPEAEPPPAEAPTTVAEPEAPAEEPAAQEAPPSEEPPPAEEPPADEPAPAAEEAPAPAEEPATEEPVAVDEPAEEHEDDASVWAPPGLRAHKRDDS